MYGIQKNPHPPMPPCVQMKVQQAVLELKLSPALVLLRSTLDQLQDKDSARIFSQPVNQAEVSAVRTGTSEIISTIYHQLD